MHFLSPDTGFSIGETQFHNIGQGHSIDLNTRVD